MANNFRSKFGDIFTKLGKNLMLGVIAGLDTFSLNWKISTCMIILSICLIEIKIIMFNLFENLDYLKFLWHAHISKIYFAIVT